TSTRVTQKFYKVSTSGRSYSNNSLPEEWPGAHMSSLSFSRVGSSSFYGARGRGGITAVTVNQSLLSPLNIEVDPNIQDICTQEKEQINTLNNRFVSFINRVQFLEQQNKMLETKWSLLLQRKTAWSNMDNILESYINNLRRQLETLGQETLKLEAELGNTQGLVKDFKNKYEDEINKRTETENEFVLIKKDVDEAYMNKVELESHLKGLTHEIKFLRQLYEEEIRKLQSQIWDTSVVLSMDNSRSLNMDSTITEVKAQSDKIAKHSRAGAESMYQIHYEGLQTLAGKHRDDLQCTKTENSKMNWNISQLETETEGLQCQRAPLEVAITVAEQRRELAVKDARAKLSELVVALQRAKQDLQHQLRKYQELMNIKLALDIENAVCWKLLEGEESWLESGLQNMSIHWKTTIGYGDALISAYGDLTTPSLSSLGSSFGSGWGSSSFSRTSSTRAMVVKVETRD
uniref:Keratin, type II cytoskeletal 8 n=1 Tax=Chlorocebus sabaeus TaxID=60711 RepID=A0A0D9RS65_CHLSB